MNNSDTNTVNAESCPTVQKQIGGTDYIVRIHFNEAATETMEEKIILSGLFARKSPKCNLFCDFDKKVLDNSLSEFPFRI